MGRQLTLSGFARGVRYAAEFEIDPTVKHRIALFGSRLWRDVAPIELRLFAFPAGTVVIEGDARGADRIGGAAAERLGFEVVRESVTRREWRILGDGAGHARNQRIIDKHHPTHGLGFVIGGIEMDLTPGSADMARRLRSAGIPTIVVRADGNAVVVGKIRR